MAKWDTQQRNSKMAPNTRMSVRISVEVTIIAKIVGTKPPTHIEDIATPRPPFQNCNRPKWSFSPRVLVMAMGTILLRGEKGWQYMNVSKRYVNARRIYCAYQLILAMIVGLHFCLTPIPTRKRFLSDTKY